MINPSDYTIILAEDDKNLRFEFKHQLRSKGFKVIEATNGLELYSYAKGLKDLSSLIIISDTDMPEMQGDEACEQLLKDFPEYKRKIIIGMSDNPNNEEYWENIGIWNSFIFKGRDIDKMLSESNLAKRVISTLNHINSNPQFYKLDNGNYRRQM